MCPRRTAGLRTMRTISLSGDAPEALRKTLSPKCNMSRSEEWLNVESRILVSAVLVCCHLEV